MNRDIKEQAKGLDSALHALADNMATLCEHGIIDKDHALMIVDNLADRFALWCLLEMGEAETLALFEELNQKEVHQ